MKIIGFDYDTKNLAWAIIEESKIETGLVCYKDIDILFDIAEDLLRENQPFFVAIEGLFLRHNPKVLIALSNIQGVLRLAAYRFNRCEPSIVTPEEAKRAIGVDVYRKPYKGSSPKEKKEMVINAVNRTVGLNLSSEHEADAVSVALVISTAKKESQR